MKVEDVFQFTTKLTGVGSLRVGGTTHLKHRIFTYSRPALLDKFDATFNQYFMNSYFDLMAFDKDGEVVFSRVKGHRPSDPTTPPEKVTEIASVKKKKAPRANDSLLDSVMLGGSKLRDPNFEEKSKRHAVATDKTQTEEKLAYLSEWNLRQSKEELAKVLVHVAGGRLADLMEKYKKPEIMKLLEEKAEELEAILAEKEEQD